MQRPSFVHPLSDYRIQLTYPDGVAGVIDLSADVGKGVLAPLIDPKFFSRVHIGEFGQIAWTDEIEICPDAAYQELVGQKVTETTHA